MKIKLVKSKTITNQYSFRMELKKISSLFLLLLVLQTIEVFAVDKDSILNLDESTLSSDSMKQQISYLQYDGTISIDSIVQHQQDHKRGGTKDCILFWVTIVSSLVSLIMLYVLL